MSEGLESMLHENQAPSEEELIQEFTQVVEEAEKSAEPDKSEAAAARRAELAEEVAKLDEKPEVEVEVKGERATGITEEEVAGDKAGEVSAPDRSLLRDQLTSLVGKEEQAAPAPAESPELAELRAISQRMMELHQQQITGKTPQELQAVENSPEAIARKAYEAAQKAQEEAKRYREELAEREQERRLELIERQIEDYATTQGEKYPLVNDGNQKLVVAAMVQSIQEGEPFSEDQALAHVEGKLRAYVEKSAARLGWQAPGTSSNDGNSGKATSSAESTITKEAVGSPAPRQNKKSWDEMSVEERDAALINLL